ncbi:MAG: DNA internalization-related competence protein ComEC/Rec2 [Rubricoccaceae bacterium]|nr:DNA internalization-related competence protein ComEC/Rec2 [Rubricoccaceae bacterium]
MQVLLGQPRFLREGERRPVYPALASGDRVRLDAVLRPLPHRRNPADFGYGDFLRRRGIHAQASVYDADAILFLGPGAGPVQRVVNAARRHVEGALTAYVRTEEARAVLAALILADRSGIERETRDRFARTGLAHLLAVSGLHVFFVGLVLYGLLKPVLGRLGFRWRTMQATRAALTLAVLLLYLLLTSGTVSVQRAVVMAAVWIGATALQRPSDTLNTLGVAALVVLLLRPAALFDVGFQLSFAAVGAIVTLTPLLERPVPPRWRERRVVDHVLGTGLATVAATLGTAPVVLFHFGQLPLSGLVLNLVAIPLTGGLLLAGLLCVLAAALPLAADAFAAVAEAATAGLLGLSQAGDALLGWSLLEGYVRDPWLVAALVLALLALALGRRPRARWRLTSATLGCCVLSVWGGLVHGNARPRLDVVFLDVNQGDATLLALPGGRHVLVDAGLQSPYTDWGERVVLPHLDRFGVARLDALVLTHPDADHIGGAASVLEGVPVGRLVHAGPDDDGALWQALVRLADSLGVPQEVVGAGDTLALDPAVRFRVLHPAAPPPPWLDRNEGSVVLRAEYGRTSFLLTGDAEAGAEAALVARYGDALASTAVKVGHHGSRTSSTARFVAAASDSATAFAVVSVAKRNRYGLPDEEPLARWAAAGAAVHLTSEEGAVWLRSDGETVERVDWRRW